MKNSKRKLNERKFKNCIDAEGGRVYKKIIEGKFGWYAEYVKVVNYEEDTLEFIQNIYDESGKLIEVHKKYPEDKGHQKI